MLRDADESGWELWINSLGCCLIRLHNTRALISAYAELGDCVVADHWKAMVASDLGIL
jgi:hypothetical protein